MSGFEYERVDSEFDGLGRPSMSADEVVMFNVLLI
jgi:hypothetical protein